MQTGLKLTATVQPGGRVEANSLFPREAAATRRSIIDVLADAPGHLMFQTADEADEYLREERDAWDR